MPSLIQNFFDECGIHTTVPSHRATRIILRKNPQQNERPVPRRKAPLQGAFANLVLANCRAKKKEGTAI
jgi:hypothetical protein